jgi:hypothetical protein
VFSSAIKNFLEQIESPSVWPDLDIIEKTYLTWKQQGVEIIELGKSKQARVIKAAVVGSGSRTAVLWAYPHPDEPIGCQALIELGNALLNERLVLDYKLILILCADPDNVNQQKWLNKKGTLKNFVEGSWRPVRLDLEVDYGFPIDYPPFYQPADYQGRCQTIEQCSNNCLDLSDCLYKDKPARPLPESIALLKALTDFKPDLVASMHNTHAAADYTFLLNREPRAIQNKILELAESKSYGTGRYLGEAVDRGARWQTKQPDLLRERKIDYFVNKLKRHPNYMPGYSYASNFSAANIIETELPGTQFICPESALFRHPDFNNSEISNEKRFIKYSLEQRRNGLSLVARFQLDKQWVIAWQDRQRRDLPESKIELAPRGLLGIEALYKRRETLDRIDQLWEQTKQVDNLVFHLYQQEREQINAPGKFVGDRSMLIFRTRKDYQRPATVAQAATFKYIYPIHTLSRIANFYNFLSVQHPSKEILEIRHQLNNICDQIIAELPAQLQIEAERGPAIKSQLARILLLMQQPD